MIIDALLESEMFSDISETDKSMIVSEIERILPRPTKELLKTLEHAYSIGMPKSKAPRVYFNEQGYGITY